MRFRLVALALAALPALASCAGPRPVHPWDLEGFPGAWVDGDLFPNLRDGMRWVFRDRVQEGDDLVISVRRDGAQFVLEGAKDPAVKAVVRRRGDWIEIHAGTFLLERYRLFSGRVGDSWSVGELGEAVVFGYDHVEVLGKPVRALVVAVERRMAEGRLRELTWFAPGFGWIRKRSEGNGKVLRDAFLVEYDPGAADHP